MFSMSSKRDVLNLGEAKSIVAVLESLRAILATIFSLLDQLCETE
jgi:hypothetical protein